MRLILRLFIKLLPWIILFAIFLYVWNSVGWPFGGHEKDEVQVTSTTVLEKIESLGNLELVKYNFQDVTELNEKNSKYLGIFPAGDSKAVLISYGEAAGCLDLRKIAPEDIVLAGDSLVITLPEPEICYYKLDMEKTRIYSIEKGVYYKDERKLIEKAYKSAESEIRASALRSGILEKTLENAEILLKPFLEEVSDKKVFFNYEVKKEKSIPKL